jgi:hypothetical protein
MARCGCGYNHDGKRVKVCSTHAKPKIKKIAIKLKKKGVVS